MSFGILWCEDIHTIITNEVKSTKKKKSHCIDFSYSYINGGTCKKLITICYCKYILEVLNRNIRVLVM